jgi:16S rRNA U516 pseudouridylate synthase RsuA-like enzyme
LGFPVKELKRIRIGRLHLGDLPPGEYRIVEKDELDGAADGAGKTVR